LHPVEEKKKKSANLLKRKKKKGLENLQHDPHSGPRRGYGREGGGEKKRKKGPHYLYHK